MTRLIHSYLTSFYRVEGNRIQPHGVIRDLSIMFAMTKKQLKYYIKGWVRKQKPSVDFKRCWKGIEYFIIDGITRPLRTEWTPEMAQDLLMNHGVDAEAELTRLFIESIEEEMTRLSNEIGTMLDEMRGTNNDIPNW